ncbi:hypothetical protein P691DRAFT_773220 [Macrolepiota fuliginosa MF-IS2]|uniref:BAG domain-containing protein n=1 Tax=Macrolepiota fuliginosa MF-IS2 TaxID=1400762 RepID=A0A9P5XKD9_9AGAR|nr:hypothetical protein P691DRAFT_773220 [Macrolepiota fuliginosa MF-IS2]
MPSYHENSHPYPNSVYLHSSHRQPPHSSAYQYSTEEPGEQEWQQPWHTRVMEEQNGRMQYQELTMDEEGRGVRGHARETRMRAQDEMDIWRQPQTQPHTYESARPQAHPYSRGPLHGRQSRPPPPPNRIRIENDPRIQQSLRAIEDISSQFNALQREFVPPSFIAFETSSGIVTAPTISSFDRRHADSNSYVPSLARGLTNRNIHAHLESLDEFVARLNSVESWGIEDVRGRRKAGIRQIQEEWEYVHGILKASWLKHIEQYGTSVNTRTVFWN